MTISSEQRETIRELAKSCCEYCRIAEGDRFARFQIDHIIPIKHGGRDEIKNLALACLKCNSYKGPNVAALDPLTGEPTRLFNPRTQQWENHFSIQNDGSLAGLTPEGRSTIAVLRINDNDRVAQRLIEIQLGGYPC